MRVYATRAGFRYLFTHALFELGSEVTRECMQALRADSRYQALCNVQGSFRARLTPKPWRCGLHRPPVRFPYETPQEKRAMQAWLQHYEEARRNYAVCDLIDVLGDGSDHAQAAEIVRLHDSATGVDRGLPLA